jgi:alpha-beta hydrolase superfamily lysophospholipase
MQESIERINGQKRNIIIWTPTSAPVGIVIICHGLHEHALRYYLLAHTLTAKGYIVYGMDHIGHGYSEGMPGMITNYNILIEDFIAFAELVQEKNRKQNIPFYVLGHCTGACVAILALRELDFVQVCYSLVRSNYQCSFS